MSRLMYSIKRLSPKLRQSARSVEQITLTSAIVFVCGCMNLTLEGGGIKGPDTDSGTLTTHGSLYGFRWRNDPIDVCPNDNGLYRVQYHTNAAYLLASVVTLGLYVPQTTQWSCNQEPIALDLPDDEPLYNPTGTSDPNQTQY